MTERVIDTAYEVQNYVVTGDQESWLTLATFHTQAEAEDCLHRTGIYQSDTEIVTAENPKWRIVRVEEVRRSETVINVTAVFRSGRLVVVE